MKKIYRVYWYNKDKNSKGFKDFLNKSIARNYKADLYSQSIDYSEDTLTVDADYELTEGVGPIV